MTIRKQSALILAALLSASAVQAVEPDSDLADLSIEQLSNIVITSVSRQEEKLGNAAASIYIISSGDIRRSGVRTLPEALRLAPNLMVARQDARNYAVSARGFSSVFANKLLVLIDGRSIYSPLFSGAFWDVQDVVMEDIERIEVISGPGASIWGVNAVNGVINIITKSARDSQGLLASVVSGSKEKDGTARYGAALQNGGNYRLYARYWHMEDVDTTPTANPTGMQRRQAGFRADLPAFDGALMVSGDVYEGELHQLNTRDIKVSGGNAIARYTRKLDNDSDLRLQLVLDHVERNQPNNFIERLDTVEIEAQHGVRIGAHNIAWGGGYRQSKDHITPIGFTFAPENFDMHWGNLFAQDEITLTPDLRFTAGAKIEHNHYTGAEYLPSLRLAWNPGPNQLVWGSLARTVRAPSRIDKDFLAPLKPIILAGKPYRLINGGPDFDSEVANVAEVGYRAQHSERVSYSATLFYADYDKLRTQEPVPGFGFEFRNMGKATARGLELWGRWQVTPNWRLSGGLVRQMINIGVKPGSRDGGAATALGTNDPRLHGVLRSSFDIGDWQQLDFTLRYNGRLPNPSIPAYYDVDMQWLWKLRPTMDVALIGQNLLHRSRPEFGGPNGRSFYERTALVKVTWRY
ncbi:TonB-dependent receptor [Duganella sp. FT92W]|uniref:TonB-dependent receptor n=1 Tax=Pseudoduganella rivuli TaxID=2666085 RepID=A0A7X2LUJ8_9BURK|nr:TonB-dependent receptor [Pseudoduganella rivuli]MRV74013.1 TonB-dependent receptor [Pseudoduganella rivuli]